MTDNQYAPPDDPCDEKKPTPPDPTPPEPTPPEPPPDPTPPPEKKCEPAYPKPPDYKPPKDECKTDCCCPPGAVTTESCLEKLIEAQTKPITAGARAKDFKEELEKLLPKARTARDEYTPEKYKALVKLWEDEDAALVDLTSKVECALHCWRCVIECHVCPLLYQLRKAEQELNGDGDWCNTVRDLQDLLYWQTRDKDAKERFFNRVKAILASWENPYATLSKILGDNLTKGIPDAKKALCADPSTALYDIFLKLIPVHFAIKPPGATSKIDDKFRKLCCCDKGKPLPCCKGIDIGEPALRRRLVGWLPFLIDPKEYFDLLCCLVSQAYVPAKDALSAAEARVTSTQNEIRRNKALVENGLKNFEKNAKAAIPISVDCKNYKCKDDKDPDKDPYKDKDKDPDKKNGDYDSQAKKY